MNKSVISIKNVSKYYKLYQNPKDRLKEALHPFSKEYHKKFYATQNLNLEIKKGEILGIVGKNGSGKSTLLKLITGVLQSDEGDIKVKGKISALLELGSGFNPEFTGLDNIFFYGTILGLTKKEIDSKLDEIISFADIGEFINQPIKTYSSGMKSRLAFAVAVNINPDILILDEVLSVGDIHFKRKSYAKMEEFFQSGKTIIYVSHSSGEVNRLCTRAIFLKDGNIIMDGEPKEVTKYYEKYLFAKEENKNSVIKEITKNQNSKEKFSKIVIEKEDEKKKNDQDSYFVEGFESKNRVEYDNSSLEIYDIRIETLEGQAVNHLITNEKYRYCYKLKFKENFNNVDFGMQIHNEKGVLISGSKNKESIDFKVNDVVEIKWEFDCMVHVGVYYTSTGVNHLVDGQREYINRIVDAYMFKVLPSELSSNGIVYLHQNIPQVKYIVNEEKNER